MKDNFEILFAEVTEGAIEIKHWSTGSVIEIKVTDTDSLKSSIWLYYHQFEDLIECINRIKK